MANRYWVGGTGTWDTTATTHWSTASGLSFTASCTATALTTVGSPALVAGMTVYSSTFVSLGTIVSGSGNSWVVSVGGTYASQTMTSGTIGASVPTAADSVFFDSAPTYTVTTTGALTCLDFTVSAGAVTFSSTGAVTVSGSLSWAGVTYSTSGRVTFAATTTGKTINTGGASITGPAELSGVGGEWTLGGAFTSGALTLTAGNLVSGNYAITIPNFTSTSSSARGLSLGTSLVTVTAGATSTVWNATNVGTQTITGTYTIRLTAASGKVFSGGNTTYYNIDQGGAGYLQITTTSTFNDIQNSYVATGATSIRLQSNLTVANFTATGASGKVLTLISNSAGTARTLTKTGGGVVSVDYMSIQDSTAAGTGATWYAGANSTNVSGNTGWIFAAAPAASGNFFMLFN